MQSSSILKSDKWVVFKNWLMDNQADIVLVIGIVLISLISFGLGRISASQSAKEPVTIEQNNESRIMNYGNEEGSVLNSEEQGSGDGQGINNATSVNTDQSSTSSNNINQGIIVASKNGAKYHWPWCSWAKKIKPENQVWFKSEAEAQKAGYTACGSFQKLAPAGYKP